MKMNCALHGLAKSCWSENDDRSEYETIWGFSSVFVSVGMMI